MHKKTKGPKPVFRTHESLVKRKNEVIRQAYVQITMLQREVTALRALIALDPPQDVRNATGN
jgi:hypothetical protein